MKVNRLLAYLMTVLSLCACAHADDKEKSDLRYLEKNFDHLYMSDYKTFWNILHGAASDARACQDISRTTEFLGLARTMRGNAEFNEFLSEEIEKLATNQTECFLSAWHKADETTQTGVLRELQYPLLVEPGDLLRVFKPYEQNKYGDLVKRYKALVR